MPAQTVIKIRRDTSTNWSSVNPILAAGEIAFETDTDKIKVGDGTTTWSSLDYFGVLDSIDDIAGVAITSASTGEVLKFDGTNWVNADVSYNELTDVPSSFTPSTHASTHELNGSDQIEIDPSQVTGTAVVDNDSRLTDARTPTSHASTHESGGTDELSLTASQISDVTSTAAELNILDGVTSTTAELNILDGVTADATELNVLDGITATTTELNYTDGVTSDIQTQLDDKEPLQRTIGVEITSRTLEIADAKKTLIAVNAVTITVPDSVFSAGHRIDFIQDASDPITFAAGTGVTINSKDGALSTSAQYAGASIVFADASTAYLIGDLA